MELGDYIKSANKIFGTKDLLLMQLAKNKLHILKLDILISHLTTFEPKMEFSTLEIKLIKAGSILFCNSLRVMHVIRMNHLGMEVFTINLIAFHTNTLIHSLRGGKKNWAFPLKPRMSWKCLSESE